MQFMALVVLFDTFCNCSDIDARAQHRTVPPFLSIAAVVCLFLLLGEL